MQTNIYNDTSAEIKELQDEDFFNRVQKIMNMFVFFLPISVVKIAGISITFFLFWVLIYYFLKNGKK